MIDVELRIHERMACMFFAVSAFLARDDRKTQMHQLPRCIAGEIS